MKSVWFGCIYLTVEGRLLNLGCWQKDLSLLRGMKLPLEASDISFWIRIVESWLIVKFIAMPDFIHFCLWHGREGLEVTDDVSIVEYLKHPVFITQGSYTNLKVSSHTPVQEFSDLQILCTWKYVSEMRTFILGMFSDSVWYVYCNHIGQKQPWLYVDKDDFDFLLAGHHTWWSISCRKNTASKCPSGGCQGSVKLRKNNPKQMDTFTVLKRHLWAWQ